MTVGQSNFGAWWARLVQSMLDQLLGQFPLERLWSKRPLITITNEVLAMSEVCDAMGALQVRRTEIEAQVVKQREIMPGQFPQEFRGAMVATLRAVIACLFFVYFVLIFLGGKGFDLVSTGPGFLPSRLDEMRHLLAGWQSGKLRLSAMLHAMVGLLGNSLSPQHGWSSFLAGFSGSAAILGLPVWLAWRYVRIAVRAHRRWRDKLREAVLLQVRTMLNTIAHQRSVTVLFVDRRPGYTVTASRRIWSRRPR